MLASHQINVRHAANELTFQVEDNCREGLQLKNFLVRHLTREDMRTFGICFGIKTRKKSEVFCSILIRRKALITIGGRDLFPYYDILCARDFNPNERTAVIFSRYNLRHLLPEQISRAIIAFCKHKTKGIKPVELPVKKEQETVKVEYVHQCIHCLSIYDHLAGEPENNLPAGTGFEHLPETYCCPLCESPKSDFRRIEKNTLALQISEED